MKPVLWTPEADAVLRAEWGKLEVPVATIAAALGRSKDGCRVRARKLGLSRGDGGGWTSRAAAALRSLAARPEGVSLSEISGTPARAAREVAASLVRSGELVSAKHGRSPRLFVSQEAADAWNGESGDIAPTSFRISRRTVAVERGEPVITAKTKFTIAPPMPERPPRTNTYSQFD